MKKERTTPFGRSARLYDAVYGFKDYRAEAERVRFLIRRHKLSAGVDLLDVACGTGAHLEWLRSHYTVEGLDLDGRLLVEARKRCPGVAFHRGDMLDFDLGRRFDVILCLFGSIGYVKTRARLRQALANIGRHLRPGGVFLLEPWLTPGRYRARRPFAVFVDRPELKLARINVTAVKGGCSVLDFHYLVATPRGVESFRERHELGLFSHADYVGALRHAGLEVRRDRQGLMGRSLYVGVPAAV